MTATGMLWAPEIHLGERSGHPALTLQGPEEATTEFLQVLWTKSPMTAEHSERVARYAVALALALDLPLAQVRHLERCGLLHDMGKLGVDEAILAKPGALTEDEWQAIRTHPDVGVRIVRNCPALAEVLPAVAYHHERFDGKGYPYGIGGSELPLDARIISICDAYDSMTADRPYRKGMETGEALRRLQAGAGTQFDPTLVEVFIATINN